MSTTEEYVTDLPSASSAALADIIMAVQGYVSSSVLGTSVQMTLQQVLSLVQSNLIQSYAGNPNGNVSGTVYQLCIDTTNSKLYVCTTTGSVSTAVWQIFGAVLVSSTQGGTGVSNPTAGTLPIANGSSAFNFQALTNGQLLVGHTGAAPDAATLTAGTNIAITNAAGSITISATGAGGFSWTEVTGTSQNMTTNNGYVANNAGLVTLALPTTSVLGDELQVIGKGAGGWSISQAAGQQINVGPSSQTTLGAGGSLASTGQFDAIYMVCTVANTTWTVACAPQTAGLTIV